jgi:peptide deformylase
MVQPLVVYPDSRIDLVSADVRVFNEELYALIEDIKDTIEANHAEGLAAIQIGVPSSVVVIKMDDGSYLELINPRIIKKSGSVKSLEQTLYLPDVERTINRYEHIDLVYEDRGGAMRSLHAEGALSLLIQRKFDYVFGGSFVTKMNAKERKNVEKELANAGVSGTFDSDGPISGREYFKSLMSKLLVLEFLTLFAPLFSFEPETIASFYNFDYYVTIILVLLNIGYFAYAKYEANRVISCTGCQVVSFVSVSVKYFIMTAVMFGASYYILRPMI